ncbi:MAG: hypothetical protein QNJ22_00320, partial [Desulfosarcinaceae bacterium]|nr:hypothetical protein [Desulfosarcinaceae bacterium]
MNARAQRKSAAPQAERSDPEAVGANNRFRRQADPSPTAKQAKIIPLPTAETPIRSTGSAPSEGAATATVAVPTTDKPSSGDAQSTPAPSTGPSPAPERPLDVFAEATPTEKIRRFPALGPALGKQIQTEKSDAASDAASVRIDLPGPQETAPPPALTVPKASKTAIDLPRGETSPVKDAAAPTAGGPHQQAKLTEAQLGASAEDMAGRHSQVDAAIDDIETTAAIRTSAGPAPELPLRGASDPERATAMDGAAGDLMDGETAAQRQWTARTKAQVQAPPVGMGGEAPVAVDTTPAEIPATRVPGDAQAYAEAELPETVRTAADSRLAAQMQTGVEGARADALAAETARDTELQTAGSDHEASLETARTQALEERKAAYKAAGGELNDSANTVDRQLAEVDKEHRGEVTKEAGAVTGKVQRRAEDDRKGAQDQLNQAETDARKKKKAAEKEARHEKGKLVKQQGKPSWWDQAVDWIRSAVNDLVDKINTLFNKLRKAIRKIIADARDAAVALLEKGRQWIVAKLDNYQKWLKEQINRYLGAFPAIQGLLLKAVDLYFGALKSAVNRVAEGLKAAVTQLANLYAALLDKILAVYQRVLTTVVQVYGAILTGNFKEAFRIAIISACEIAKVDPNPVLAFVDRAGELAQRALMHLIQFWFNVGSAIGKGIKQFGANIKKHLIGGIIGWLTGALGDSGIEIPQQFDLKGVLRLVMSVMGLTYDRIRRKVVKRLGPGGETAVGRMEKAAGLMRRLATEGPLALWEDLKKAVSELPKLLMAALAKWLSIAIIKEATIWLLALVFPVSAVLKIVKLLFDLVQFLIERFRQIVDFVKSVYNAIKEIILGNVQKAADAIESAMARSLPVIISFLASLIGLGGIGKAVRGVITKLRRPIDKVVDKVIKKLVKLGRRFVAKGKAAAKKLRRWWQARRRFTTKGGEAHEISFKGEGKRARLMVKSTPKTY